MNGEWNVNSLCYFLSDIDVVVHAARVTVITSAGTQGFPLIVIKIVRIFNHDHKFSFVTQIPGSEPEIGPAVEAAYRLWKEDEQHLAIGASCDSNVSNSM